MYLDRKLLWNEHIDQLKVKVQKSLNILKVVSRYNWGADKTSLLRLYNALCLSKLDYGCQIYGSASKSHLQKLDRIHNAGLRICSGVLKTSPVESIYVDTEQIPLDLRREELGLRYFFRLQQSSNNPACKVLRENDPNKFAKRLDSKPFQIRIANELEDESLKTQKIFQNINSIIPPWKMQELNICPKLISKKSS